jgi:hypothetical protein
MNGETKCRERVLNYKMPFESTLVGKGIITTREKQVNIDAHSDTIEKIQSKKKTFLNTI